MGKRGKLEKNLRFAMGVGLGGDIFLRFGGKDGGYWVVRGLNITLPYSKHRCTRGTNKIKKKC